jgi:hypothetical protein
MTALSDSNVVTARRSSEASASPARQARIAGLLYLIVIGGGLFSEGYARGSLFVPGDAAATMQAIQANEGLWRWGLAVHLSYLVLSVLTNLILYGLFKMVHGTLARLALVFSMVGLTIEAVTILHLYVPLALIEEAGAVATLGEGQRQALAYLAIRLFSTGWSFGLLFFAGFCTTIGLLIRRSRLIPHPIGTMMITAGVCYVVNSLVFVVSPALSELIVPWILVPVLIAELSLALWLTTRGVRVEAGDNREENR